ncbi:hypothetical protein QFZ57_004062 [Arthrobacter sp. B1I2]|nr:hypothetical protein [Arthrobacter sp. B1I2]
MVGTIRCRPRRRPQQWLMIAPWTWIFRRRMVVNQRKHGQSFSSSSSKSRSSRPKTAQARRPRIGLGGCVLKIKSPWGHHCRADRYSHGVQTPSGQLESPCGGLSCHHPCPHPTICNRAKACCAIIQEAVWTVGSMPTTGDNPDGLSLSHRFGCWKLPRWLPIPAVDSPNWPQPWTAHAHDARFCCCITRFDIEKVP